MCLKLTFSLPALCYHLSCINIFHAFSLLQFILHLQFPCLLFVTIYLILNIFPSLFFVNIFTPLKDVSFNITCKIFYFHIQSPKKHLLARLQFPHLFLFPFYSFTCFSFHATSLIPSSSAFSAFSPHFLWSFLPFSSFKRLAWSTSGNYSFLSRVLSAKIEQFGYKRSFSKAVPQINSRRKPATKGSLYLLLYLTMRYSNISNRKG